MRGAPARAARRISSGALALVLVLAATSAARAQAPEDRGALAIDEWDAGRVDHAGARIPTRVLFPTDGTAPYPLVGVIHGAGRTGARHRVLAETLASRGFVVILPDIPCGFTGCNHDENADQLVAMLEWAVTRSADASSPIAGLVDGSRRALIGHSWGALASHLAAARDPSLDAVVLFDPNDDGTVGRDATASITAPVAQLLADVPGACNSAWDEGAVTPMLPAPALELTVRRSAHCDPEEPGDFVCPLGCGAGDPATSAVFRRYAVAWVSCFLQDDASMAPWLGGGSMSGDESDRVIEGVVRRGFDGLPCRATTETDAGAAVGDAGTSVDAGTDDGGVMDASAATDGGGTDADATDASLASGVDAGSVGGTDGGCGCRAINGSAGGPWALLALGLLAARRRR
ncbi:MAG: dienelactone hydrolase family protein [Myxococcales bacterium]|nr:dienelactone hydrolase family protein [Myxococcales bacterium]